MNARTVMAACALAALLLGARPARSDESHAAARSSFAAQAALFHYDAHADLAMQEAAIEHRDGVAVHDISFLAVPGTKQRVKAYLVVPSGAGPFAGVLWTHWL